MLILAAVLGIHRLACGGSNILLTHAAPRTASPECPCSHHPPSGALGPVKGEATIGGWRLAANQHELMSMKAKNGRRRCLKLPSLDPQAQLLGVLELASQGKVEVVTGWGETPVSRFASSAAHNAADTA
jgi:hypothetical protein